MGLIKTAIIAGAGIYAVNKLSERRQSQQSQSRQQYIDNAAAQQQHYPPAQNQGGQSQPRYVPMEFTDRRGGQQQSGQNQPQYLLSNDAKSKVPSYGYNAEGGYYFEAEPRNASAPVPEKAYANNGSSYPPPQYENYSQDRKQGFVEPDEVSTVSDSGYAAANSPRSGRRNSGGSADFLDSLMQRAGGLADGRGKDFMNKFLK